MTNFMRKLPTENKASRLASPLTLSGQGRALKLPRKEINERILDPSEILVKFKPLPSPESMSLPEATTPRSSKRRARLFELSIFPNGEVSVPPHCRLVWVLTPEVGVDREKQAWSPLASSPLKYQVWGGVISIIDLFIQGAVWS